VETAICVASQAHARISIGEEMTLFSLMYLAIWIGEPLSLLVAWWLWQRRTRPDTSTWRSAALFSGLLCASGNVCLYFLWAPLAKHFFMTQTPQWRIFDIDGDIGVFLVGAALICAILGVGKSRVPLAACAILGLLLWLPVGVL
jgi:hypothetical protein